MLLEELKDGDLFVVAGVENSSLYRKRDGGVMVLRELQDGTKWFPWQNSLRPGINLTRVTLPEKTQRTLLAI